MSGIDQYCEAIPGPSGDRGNTDTDRGGRPLPAATLRALERSGADGQSIIGLSGPASAQEAKRKGQPAAGAVPATPKGPLPSSVRADRPSENPLAAVASGFADTGDTAGPLFGTLLLLLALVFFATAWLRYRRRAQA